MYKANLNFSLSENPTDTGEFRVLGKVVVPGFGQSEFDTRLCLPQAEWDSNYEEANGDSASVVNCELEKIRKGFQVAVQFYTRLGDIKYGAEEITRKFYDWYFDVTITRAADLGIVREKKKSISFQRVFEEINQLKKLKDPTWYHRAIHFIGKYIDEELEADSENFSISDWTKPDMVAFELFIRKQPSERYKEQTLSLGSIRNVMDKLLAMLKHAATQEYIPKDPSLGYSTSKIYNRSIQEILEATRRITPDQLKRIEKEVPEANELNKARIHWLIQSYTGMAVSDLVKHEWEIKVKEGKKWLIYYRRKNGVIGIVPFLSQTQKLFKELDTVGWYKISPYKEGDRKIQDINRKRDEYRMVLNGLSDYYEFPIKSHDARHTFAYRMLDEGITLEALSRMMAHESIKETQNTYGVMDTGVIQNAINKTNFDNE